MICAWFSLSKTSGITARNVQIMISAICAFWPELKIINIKISNKSMEGLWREIGWWSLQSQKRTKYVKLLYLSENQLETFPWYVVGIFEKNTQCLILYASMLITIFIEIYLKIIRFKVFLHLVESHIWTVCPGANHFLSSWKTNI